MKLVIVESPAKAKTIGKFLGKDYRVVASFGHIRDLPGRATDIPAEIKDKPWARMAVDVDGDFTPYYVVQPDSKKHIAEIRKLLKDSDEIVLATDEDREGESISWHLLETLKPKVPVKRIAFHEITKSAIDEAIANPRALDEKLVSAQESRRILDRLFGYSLSPVLWKKVRTNLSAGRVQSVAVRLVVEREEERRAFRTAGYWDIEATLEAGGIEFTAALNTLGGQRIAEGRDFEPNTGQLKTDDVLWLREADAKRVAKELAEKLPWRVAAVDRKEAKMSPWPPFITSSLQQGASALLGFSPRQTMQIAQRLYEGIDLGGGEREGLITYMRTDSVTLSEKALHDAASFIHKKYGERYHQRRTYKSKIKNAQEAHEAIRPTVLSRTPEQVAGLLDDADLKLYRLIWNRTIACQMADAQLEKTAVDFEAQADGKTAMLRANGSVVVFDGFLKIADSKQSDTQLPHIEVGQQVGPSAPIHLKHSEPVEHSTKPPARYTEAALVRRLEEEGIGRPSTYAPTIATIQAREYVEKRGSALVPSFLGIATTQLLRQHFSEYVDLQFTARMEDRLDDIANGDQDPNKFLSAFYRGGGEHDFGDGLKPNIERELKSIEFPAIPIGNDPESGQPIVVRLGRTQPFLQRGEGGDGNTATIPNELAYDELTVEKALELLATRAKADEPLGKDPATGLHVFKFLGPYGPYVQLGSLAELEALAEREAAARPEPVEGAAPKKSKAKAKAKAKPKAKKPKRASLPKGTNLDKVDFALAMQYLTLPRQLGVHPETEKKIDANLGRFGPYVAHHKDPIDYRSIPKDKDVFTITLDEALVLLAQPKGVRGRSAAAAKKVLRELGPHPATNASVNIYDGKYGAYLSDGKVNATIPKGTDPNAVTMEQAVALLAEAAARGPAKKRPPARRKASA